MSPRDPAGNQKRWIASFGPFADVYHPGPDRTPGYLHLLHSVVDDEVVGAVHTVAGDSGAAPYIERMLADPNWRPQLIAAVAVALGEDPAPFVESLWRAVQAGSWVAPQLLATLFVVDREFEARCRQRIDARCPLEPPAGLSKPERHVAAGPADDGWRAGKEAGAILALCARIPARRDWATAARDDGEITALLTADRDGGARIASAWLDSLLATLEVRGVDAAAHRGDPSGPAGPWRSARYRSGPIFSVLQSTVHLSEPLTRLAGAQREGLSELVARVIAAGTDGSIGERVVAVYREHAPGFEEAWGRFAGESDARERLGVVAALARGEFGGTGGETAAPEPMPATVAAAGAPPPSLEQRVRGVLYGQAIGDALGLGAEFLSKADVAWHYPEGLTRYDQIIQDSHRKRWHPGDWTDDTDQMTMILDSLLELGRVDPSDIGRRIANWVIHAHGVGVGNTVYAVLKHPDFATDPHAAARAVWEQTGRRAAANGGVMRTSVLGLWDFHDRARVERNAADVCRVTHFDPRCVGSCVAVSLLVNRLVHGSEPDASLLADVRAAAAAHDERVGETFDAVLGNPDPAVLDLESEEAMGYTLKTLGAGLWAVVHAPDLATGLYRVIAEGGDADSNGAVAGALLGARFGFDAIPAHLVNGLTRTRYLERVAGELLAAIGSSRP